MVGMRLMRSSRDNHRAAHCDVYSPNIHHRVTILIFQLKTSSSLITQIDEERESHTKIICFHLVKIILITLFGNDWHCWS